MEFNTTTTAITFITLFAILVGGTSMSPISTITVAMISIRLMVFGVLSLLIGVKHGDYRVGH